MLTHIDDNKNPTMVDVGEKQITYRQATAVCKVLLPSEILEHLKDGDIKGKKGPVFHTAIIAATMAVKKTSDLIPFCHPLPIENIKIQIKVNIENQVEIQSTVSLHHKTGVEMEALMGAHIAALTIYDMCKAMSHDICITDLQLIHKSGGKSDYSKA